MCQMHPNSNVQLWNWFLTINSDSTHQKWMKFASLSLALFFFNHIEFRTMCHISGTVVKNQGVGSALSETLCVDDYSHI